MTIADRIDRLTARPGFTLGFNLALIAVLGGAGVDAANFFISIVTAEIVLLGAAASRRGMLATHAKLDELIRAADAARDALIGAEDRPEAEIARLRHRPRPSTDASREHAP